MWPFTKKSTNGSAHTETLKNDCGPSWGDALRFQGQSFLDYLSQGNLVSYMFPILSAYYRTCPPVADAIDRIAKEFAAISPKIYDKKQGQFVDTDFLDVLENPNVSMTKHQFLYNYAATSIIFGTVLPYGTGVTKLQELSYIEPMYLTLQGLNTNDVQNIRVTKGTYTQEYDLFETKNFNLYISPSKTQVAKLVRTYNPDANVSQLFGISKLAAISFEIEQYLAASRHNLSLLSLGVKSSGIVTFEGGLPSLDEEKRLKALFDAYRSGPANAGRTMFLGSNYTYTPLDNSIDSDFQVLRGNVEAAIYRRLEIPAALITNTAMTFNNLEVAQLMLYDNAVMPLLKTLYKPLQDIIFYYGKIDPTRYVMTYDENEVAALALRKTQLIAQKSSTNAYTANEIRSWYGDDRLASGGDEIYVLSTQVPAGDNAYTETETPKPTTPDPVDDDE